MPDLVFVFATIPYPENTTRRCLPEEETEAGLFGFLKRFFYRRRENGMAQLPPGDTDLW